ncbi:glycine betaine/proline transport system ATP-binding protein [Kushneria avicenniae]|uniref:Glycine betaine/proline transport system ATP-binding protein n=1 Tax=Kushneria avicenniae TaxID=402385 RepID=A0A1I1G5S7_9GAMM|nr:ATP-binding cassette domain-containing protein [Kushneria avicenniae]SFC06692.1 glycine betaine/proline transport system ATP-binding protein [Kushneria avicenniae]
MITLKEVWKIFSPDPQATLSAARQDDIDGKTLKQQSATIAVRNVDLAVTPGELLCVMGLSGCGKSTLIRLVNRLLTPTSGQVLIGDSDIGRLNTAQLRRLRSQDIGMVFQSHGLIGHLSVRDNVALPLEIQRIPRHQREDRADELLQRTGLGGLGDRNVSSLSGGMQQRVGLARALAADPGILLMDEPFSALDPLIRRELQDEFGRLSRDLGKTTLFITHDVEEAFRIADRVALMRAGRIVQLGKPQELVDAPADDYVARFVEPYRTTPEQPPLRMVQ